MFRRTFTLFVVLLGVGFAGDVSAQDDWKVRAGTQQKRKIVARYTKVLLDHPERTLLVRRLVEKVGNGPALDRLIERVAGVADDQPDRAEPRILLGHLLAEAGRPTEALKAYRAAVAAEPDDAEAHSALGLALVDAGLPDDARSHLEKALDLQNSDAARRDLLRRLADLAIAADKPDEAVRWFERLVAERPRDVELRVEFAELLARARQYGRAVQEYESALERVGRNGKRRAMILRDLGSLYRRMHDPVAAADHYRAAMRLTARGNWMRRELWTRLIDVHREMNRLPDIYDELVKQWRHPGYSESMQLASLADEVHLPRQATKWLERARRLDRRALEPRTRLIARLGMSDEPERVRRLYDEVLRLRPDNVIHRMELAEWLYFQQRESERAVELLREAERRWSDDPDALVEIAGTWHRFGLAEEALRLHRVVGELEPRHVANLEAWGELEAKRGNNETAKEIWNRLLSDDPNDVRSRLRVAELLLRVDDTDTAIEHLEAVVAEHPDVPDLRQRLASSYERARQWDDALAQWERLYFEWDVQHAARRIISIVDTTYDVETARRWERRWREEGSLPVGIVTARMQQALRSTIDPVEIAERIVEHDPDELTGADRLAWTEAVGILVDFHAVNSPAEAIAWLRKLADAMAEQRIPTARRIVDIAFTMEPEKAEPHFAYAVRVAPNDPHVRAQTGNFFGTNGDPEQAIEHLTRAIELGPNGFEPYFDLVHYLTETGREEQAREVLLKVVARDRSGKAAVSAALAALDLCANDEDVMDLERRVRSLRGRIPSEEFRTIMVGVYQVLFVYGEHAERAFARLGNAAFPIIVDAVQSSRADVQSRSAMLTRLYEPARVVERAVRSWTEPVNEQMAWLLVRSGDPRARPKLEEALESRRELVRHIGLIGLAEVAGEESAPALLNAVDSGEETATRALAAMVLGGLSGEGVVERLGALAEKDPDQAVRIAATWALGRTADASAAALLQARLADDDPEVAATASWALASMRSDAALQALFEAYWSGDERARAEAERGLRMQARYAGKWWSMDDERLETPDPVVLMRRTLRQAHVIIADRPIARALRGHPVAVAGVAASRLDTEEWREKVLDDLVAIAEEAPEEDRAAVGAVVVELRPSLRRLVTRSEPAVVESAALLLPHAQNPNDVDAVVGAAAKLKSSSSARVVESLSLYPWESVREPLLDEATDGSPQRRRASLRAIQRSPGAADDPEVLDIVRRSAREGPTEVRAVAIEVLGALRRDESTDMLVEMFDEADYRTRVAIIASLKAMGTERAEKAAKQLLVVPIKRPCEGDPDDLEELLTDECVGIFDVPDF